MVWLLLSTILIFCSKISANGQGQGQYGGNYTIRNLNPGDGWVPFQYGQVGQPPFNLMHLSVGLLTGQLGGDQPGNFGPSQMGIYAAANYGGRNGGYGQQRCYLEITDAFCPGDRFEVILLGKGGIGPQTILTTPVVPYNAQVAQEICDGLPVQCANSTANPEIAYYDPTWSSGRVLIRPGSSTIVIKPLASPYCAGAGFVRIRCMGHPRPPHPPHPPHPPNPTVLCNYTEGGFRMVMTPVQGPQAGSVCTSLGMKLADITNANFVASTNVAFKCSGPLSTSWIGTWNGQSWAGQQGLGLTVSTASPGGSINIYNDGVARNVLCQGN